MLTDSSLLRPLKFMQRKIYIALLMIFMSICSISVSAKEETDQEKKNTVPYQITKEEEKILLENAHKNQEQKDIFLELILSGRISADTVTEAAESGIIAEYADDLKELGLISTDLHIQSGIEQKDLYVYMGITAPEELSVSDNSVDEDSYCSPFGHTYNEMDENAKTAFYEFLGDPIDDNCYLDLLDPETECIVENDMLEYTLLNEESCTFRFFDKERENMLYSWTFLNWIAPDDWKGNLKADITENSISFKADCKFPKAAVFSFKAPDPSRKVNLYKNGTFLETLTPDVSGYVSFQTDDFTKYEFREGEIQEKNTSEENNTESATENEKKNPKGMSILFGAVCIVIGTCVACHSYFKASKK